MSPLQHVSMKTIKTANTTRKEQRPRYSLSKQNRQGHPILDRMMRSLQQQRSKQVAPLEETFVIKTSFASSNNKVYGRKYELQQLFTAYKRISSNNTAASRKTKSELVLIHGKSGVGKSSLVHAFFKQLPQEAFFVSDKFDQLRSHVPYAALIRACNNLAKQALERETIRARLQAEMGPDTTLLGTLLKEVSRLLQNHQKEAVSMSGQAFTRFKLLIRSFFRSIATAESPVVLFMDDLQWADLATVEVLQGLMSDQLSSHLLLLVAYRDDEIQEETLKALLSDSTLPDQDQASCSFNISVSNLECGPLNEMISSALQMDPKKTKSLTNVIMHKTEGNPYYALNFMDMLCSRDILQRGESEESNVSNDSFWEWDVNTILQQTNVTDNLANILESKILRLPEKVRSILQLASFIGFDFSTEILTTIVHEEQDMIEGECSFEFVARETVQQWIIHALDVALKEGLVELTGDADDGTFKFSHDKIQQCLYKDLMPDDVERRLLHQRIGKLLWNTFRKQEIPEIDDWILFLAADNLNRGPKFVDDHNDRREMIELNLRAAKLAAKKAAFLVAVEYIRAGGKLVANDDFVKQHYELCMDLFGTGADLERKVGCHDGSNEFVDKIHKHARTLEDRFVAYLSEVTTLAIRGNPPAAISQAFKILRLFGERFPKKITPWTIIKEFLRTKWLIGKREAKDLLHLPTMTDKKKQCALKLLSAISGYLAALGESAALFIVVVGLRMTFLSVRYGLSEQHSGQSFVGYAIFLTALGNYEKGSSYGKLAMQVVEKFNAESVAGRVQVSCFQFIRPWKDGISDDLIDGFVEAYHKSMLHGDIDYAHWGSMGWIFSSFIGGRSLPLVVKQARIFCMEMKEYGAQTHLLANLPMWQVCLNMVGDDLNPKPTILSGEALNFDEFMVDIIASNSAVLKMHVLSIEAITAHYFNDWDRARTNIFAIAKQNMMGKDYWTATILTGHEAWCCFALHYQTRKRKYQRMGRKILGMLEKYSAQGSPLASIAVKQVKAAKALYVKKQPPQVAEDCFAVTFEALKECRALWPLSYMSEALANAFFEAGDYAKGAHYLNMSIDITYQWGALAKHQLLQNQLSSITAYLT